MAVLAPYSIMGKLARANGKSFSRDDELVNWFISAYGDKTKDEIKKELASLEAKAALAYAFADSLGEEDFDLNEWFDEKFPGWTESRVNKLLSNMRNVAYKYYDGKDNVWTDVVALGQWYGSYVDSAATEIDGSSLKGETAEFIEDYVTNGSKESLKEMTTTFKRDYPTASIVGSVNPDQTKAAFIRREVDKKDSNTYIGSVVKELKDYGFESSVVDNLTIDQLCNLSEKVDNIKVSADDLVAKNQQMLALKKEASGAAPLTDVYGDVIVAGGRPLYAPLYLRDAIVGSNYGTTTDGKKVVESINTTESKIKLLQSGTNPLMLFARQLLENMTAAQPTSLIGRIVDKKNVVDSAGFTLEESANVISNYRKAMRWMGDLHTADEWKEVREQVGKLARTRKTEVAIDGATADVSATATLATGKTTAKHTKGGKAPTTKVEEVAYEIPSGTNYIAGYDITDSKVKDLLVRTEDPEAGKPLDDAERVELNKHALYTDAVGCPVSWNTMVATILANMRDEVTGPKTKSGLTEDMLQWFVDLKARGNFSRINIGYRRSGFLKKDKTAYQYPEDAKIEDAINSEGAFKRLFKNGFRNIKEVVTQKQAKDELNVMIRGGDTLLTNDGQKFSAIVSMVHDGVKFEGVTTPNGNELAHVLTAINVINGFSFGEGKVHLANENIILSQLYKQAEIVLRDMVADADINHNANHVIKEAMAGSCQLADRILTNLGVTPEGKVRNYKRHGFNIPYISQNNQDIFMSKQEKDALDKAGQAEQERIERTWRALGVTNTFDTLALLAAANCTGLNNGNIAVNDQLALISTVDESVTHQAQKPVDPCITLPVKVNVVETGADEKADKVTDGNKPVEEKKQPAKTTPQKSTDSTFKTKQPTMVVTADGPIQYESEPEETETKNDAVITDKEAFKARMTDGKIKKMVKIANGESLPGKSSTEIYAEVDEDFVAHYIKVTTKPGKEPAKKDLGEYHFTVADMKKVKKLPEEEREAALLEILRRNLKVKRVSFKGRQA